MRDRRRVLRRIAGATIVGVFLSGAVLASGFSVFEQGSKAMGMAGAFTAQADDPSALFHNVGGLAFFDETAWQAGLTLITTSEAEFEGGLPFPGPEGSDELEGLAAFVPHAYWIRPINQNVKFGLAVNAPFGLTTEWPDDFSGRFISTMASLRSVDINPNIGFKLSDNFGVGIGAILRVSDVELNRATAIINPFTQQPVDVATTELVADFSEGFGFQAGFLHKVNNSFSWGANYRGPVEIDYTGDASFTQVSTGNPLLDALTAASIPFGTDVGISTTIEMPDSYSIGFAFALNPRWLLEIDYNWVGWSTFDEIVVDFEGEVVPALISAQDWEDVNNYRLGLKWMRGGGKEWRFGYVFDENPIPDSTLGPLLPDGDRNGFTVGYGNTRWDVALMYLPIDERVVTTNEDNFNGTYNTTAWLFSGTFNF